jgi:hypothetical protein
MNKKLILFFKFSIRYINKSLQKLNSCNNKLKLTYLYRVHLKLIIKIIYS